MVGNRGQQPWSAALPGGAVAPVEVDGVLAGFKPADPDHQSHH